MHLSISPHKPGKTWPSCKWHLKSRGNVRVGFWERSSSTNLMSLHWCRVSYLSHLLTLLTVLATFVSRQLLNPNGHPHPHTYIYSFALSQLANYSYPASLSRLRLPFQTQFLHVRVGVLYLWFSRNTSDIISFPQAEIICLKTQSFITWRKYRWSCLGLVFHPPCVNDYKLSSFPSLNF